MKTRGFIFIAASLVLLSCEKDKGMNNVYSEKYISLDAAPGATKGFLNTGGLTVDGTQFQMFDYLSGYNGTISGHSGGTEFQYFGNTLTYKSDATNWKWLFGSVSDPVSYKWTRTGTHHFFGWMLKDATGGATDLQSSTFFDTWTPGEKTLSVSKDLSIDDAQYDFLYSDVVPVDVIHDGIPESVPIPMSHLFGAVGITVKNTSDLDITVRSVRLKNFPANGSATISYDMVDGVSVAQANPSSSGTYAYWDNIITTPFTLQDKDDPNTGKVYDCLTGTEIPSGGQPQFRLAWPMTFEALEPIKDHDDEDGNPVWTTDSPLIEVTYSEEGGSPATVTFRFPRADAAKAAVTAGKKTQINLTFANKQVILSYDILPWDYTEFPMAFEDDAISTTQLKFVEGTFNSLPKVTDASGKHDVIQLKENSTEGSYTAKGTFKAYTPVNARLIVTLGGSGEDFEVSLDSGTTTTGGNTSITIDPHRDGGLISLRIKPRGTPKSGSKCYLHFAVLNGNRESDADTEINRDNYMIVIP